MIWSTFFESALFLVLESWRRFVPVVVPDERNPLLWFVNSARLGTRTFRQAETDVGSSFPAALWPHNASRAVRLSTIEMEFHRLVA